MFGTYAHISWWHFGHQSDKVIWEGGETTLPQASIEGGGTLPHYSNHMQFYYFFSFFTLYKSSSMFFCPPTFEQKWIQKADTTRKVRNFGILPHNILFFFIFCGALPPGKRQVGYFANIPLICFPLFLFSTVQVYRGSGGGLLCPSR